MSKKISQMLKIIHYPMPLLFFRPSPQKRECRGDQVFLLMTTYKSLFIRCLPLQNDFMSNLSGGKSDKYLTLCPYLLFSPLSFQTIANRSCFYLHLLQAWISFIFEKGMTNINIFYFIISIIFLLLYLSLKEI